MMLHKIINPLKETLNNFPNVNIKNIKSNSKEVTKGDLFIAVNGNVVDGNNFIDEAIELGASAIITSNKKVQEKAIPHIIVQDARKTLSNVASSFYGNPSKKLKVKTYVHLPLWNWHFQYPIHFERIQQWPFAYPDKFPKQAVQAV